VVAGGMQSDVSHERLHWAVEVADQAHDIEIMPSLLASVGIDLDSRRVAEVPKPAKQHPWREVSFACDGHPVVVALTWALPVMHTDVFVDGRSLIDGRRLEATRLAAPAPVNGYDHWMNPGFRLGIDKPRFLPTAARVPVVVAVLALVALTAAGRQVSGPLVGGAALIALSVLAGVWFYWWLVVTVRVNRYLLAHPELGNARRLAAFWGVFLGWPVASVGLVALPVALLSR
jgi:hypothetical protein